MNDALPDVATIPTILRTIGWSDYAMIDSGSGRKLERFGPYRVIRPEPQCLWLPKRPTSERDAAAGAQLANLDASKKAIGWARENADLSKMADKPVRWICEDARKYVQREVRRESTYDGIILDPPKYGRGPTGEVWRLFEHLPDLLGRCAQLLAPGASFLLLNAYAERISGLSLSGLLAGALPARSGIVDWGELALMEE